MNYFIELHATFNYVFIQYQVQNAGERNLLSLAVLSNKMNNIINKKCSVFNKNIRFYFYFSFKKIDQISIPTISSVVLGYLGLLNIF